MENLLIIVASIMGGVATYYISVNLKKGPVFASAIVTLVAGIILPKLFTIMGTNLAIAVTCSSYAGMVAVKNVPKLWEMAGVSLITGVIFIATTSAYVGVGGRLGTIAAIACFTWLGCKKVYYILKISKEERNYKEKADNNAYKGIEH